MGVKAVVDIDLDLSRFQKFSDLFNKYQEQLAKTPSAWAKVNKENEATAKHLDRLTAAILAQHELAKTEADAQRAQEKHLTYSQRLWQSISSNTKTVAKNITGATIDLLKWSGILGAVGGLLGAGGLWGIDRMAERVGDQRRSSGGLGLSIGEQKAFGVDFGRFLDPDAFLSGVNQATTDLSKQGSLYALGVNPNGSTSDVAVATLKALRAKALATPVNQLGLLEQQYGLGTLGVGVKDLQRLRQASPQEFNAQLARYASDRRGLDIGDQTAQAWQNFANQLDRAGSKIFKTFVEGLGPLEKPIEKLSESLARLIATAMQKDGAIEHGIDKIAGWIKSLSDSLDDGAFQANLKKFFSATGDLADAMDRLAHPGQLALDAINPVNNYKAIGSGIGSVFSWAKKGIFGLSGSAAVAAEEQQYHLPDGLLDYVWGKESSRSFTAPTSATGAMGPFQIEPAMTGGYNVADFDQAKERAAQILAQEIVHYHGDVQKALVAYNRGDAKADKLFASDPNWRTKDTYSSDWKGTSNVQVTINNQTGGAAVPQVNALVSP